MGSFEKFEPAMLESADRLSAEKPEAFGLEQLNIIKNRFEKQRKKNEKEEVEHRKAEAEEFKIVETEIDSELDEAYGKKQITFANLDAFLKYNFANNLEAKKIAKEHVATNEDIGIPVFSDELKNLISSKTKENKKLSIEDQIKTMTDQLKNEGKPTVEILKTLIQSYENDPFISEWVNNWRNLIDLQDFAQTKSEPDRKAIERIVSNADFTAIDSFNLVLIQIEESTDITTATKIEIKQKFNTSGISTIPSIDDTLKDIQNYKTDIEQKIGSKKESNSILEAEITGLKEEIGKLPPDDPKRTELEEELQTKTEALKQGEDDLAELSQAKPEKVYFLLRQNILAVLNPDGSRSVKLIEDNFEIRLPRNIWILGNKPNMESVNLAFVASPMLKLDLAHTIFDPDLVNGAVPTKEQRLTGNIILVQLGYDTSRILSEDEIQQLEKDLEVLRDKDSGRSGREDLTELGIWSVANGLNKKSFKKVLRIIRENRGMN